MNLFKFLGILAFILIFSTVFSIKSDSYSLSEYVGDVEISHDQGREWNTATSEMPLQEADTVKTGVDSYCDINMPGRGNFRVVENSRIYISSLKKQLEAIKVENGKALFNIAVKLLQNENFQVETTVAVAAVRGTEFEVDSDSSNGKINVSVEKGRVLIKRNVKLPAGLDTVEYQDYLEVIATNNQTLEMTSEENASLETLLNSVKDNREEFIKALSDSKNSTEKKIKIMKKNIRNIFNELNNNGNTTGSDDTSDIISNINHKVGN